MLGSRAIWHQGWKAVSTHEPQSGVGNYDADVWQLFHTDEDPTESRDLADQEPERLRRLIELWWAEAEEYDVLPLDDRGWERFNDPRPRLGESDEYVYLPGAAPVKQRAAVDTVNRDFAIRADVTLPDDGAEGVLLAHGSRFGGFSLYVKDRALVFAYKVAGIPEWRLSAPVDLRPGRRSLGVRFVNTGEHCGIAFLTSDDVEVVRGELARTGTIFPVDSGLTCGYDRGLTVTTDYEGPFPFSGTIHNVTVSVGPRRSDAGGLEFDAVLGQQ